MLTGGWHQRGNRRAGEGIDIGALQLKRELACLYNYDILKPMPPDRERPLGEAMRVLGAILLVLGFLLSLSIVGAIVGIPMMLIGLVCLVVGGRRKTIITNVVQVSNVAPPVHSDSSTRPPDRLSVQSSTPLPQFQPMQRRLKDLKSLPADSPVIEAEYREERSRRGAYDRAKWDALVKYDADISRIVAALQPYGQKYVDEFAAAYLALNDKRYLGMIVQKVVADAKQEWAASQRQASTQRR